MVSTGGGRVFVSLGGRMGCPACDAGRGCGAGVFGKLLKRRPVVLDFDNHLSAKPGDAVIVGLPEALFLVLATRFYLYPLLAGLAGAAAGHYVSAMFHSGAALGDALTVLTAAAAGAVAIWRSRSRTAEFPEAIAVHLLRVVDNLELDFDKEVAS